MCVCVCVFMCVCLCMCVYKYIYFSVYVMIFCCRKYDIYIYIYQQVYCHGQIIGGIVADTKLNAQKAVKKVKVEYEEMKPIITIEVGGVL